MLNCVPCGGTNCRCGRLALNNFVHYVGVPWTSSNRAGNWVRYAGYTRERATTTISCTSGTAPVADGDTGNSTISTMPIIWTID